MEIMSIGSVAAITVICYLVGMTVRQTTGGSGLPFLSGERLIPSAQSAVAASPMAAVQTSLVGWPPSAVSDKGKGAQSVKISEKR